MAKRYYQMPKKSFRLRSKNVGSKCLGANELIAAAQKGRKKEIKDNQLLKQSGIDLTLTNFHAFNVYKKMVLVFELFIITDETTFISS